MTYIHSPIWAWCPKWDSNPHFTDFWCDIQVLLLVKPLGITSPFPLPVGVLGQVPHLTVAANRSLYIPQVTGGASKVRILVSRGAGRSISYLGNFPESRANSSTASVLGSILLKDLTGCAAQGWTQAPNISASPTDSFYSCWRLIICQGNFL